MSDIPPKVVRSQVRSVRRRAPGSPARTGGLPVLHAFQTFIDTERRRAQRRLLGLAFVFLALLICVAGAGVLAGRHFLNQANDKYLDLEEAVKIDRQSALGSRKITGDALRRIDRELEAERQLSRRNSDKLHLELRTTHGVHSNELARVMQAMALLREESLALKREIAALKTDVPAVSNRVEELLAQFAPREQPPAPPAALPPRDRIPLVITPRDTGRPVTWFLPIPE